LSKEMQVELKRMQGETGITFVFVTHDQEEALTMSDRVAVMKDGKILQVGSPREIYNSPVNRFVADFIGETNFLTGKVVDGNGVRLGSGEVLAVATGQPEGREVTLAVRPEQVRIGAADDKDGLAATVAGAIYFGTDTQIRLRLVDGTEIVARLQNTPTGETGITEGASVSVRFADGAVKALED
ncbi:MAG: ABC transporter ATP-binding protein, partial [Paracoccaceae bacterium]|nr:ABC transporter ATP-binding protein [Paracoccaceae bacterium]